MNASYTTLAMNKYLAWLNKRTKTENPTAEPYKISDFTINVMSCTTARGENCDMILHLQVVSDEDLPTDIICGIDDIADRFQETNRHEPHVMFMLQGYDMTWTMLELNA